MQPFVYVSPEKCSERNIVKSVLNALNDYIPHPQNKISEPTEKVLAFRFDECDSTSKLCAYTIVISVVTCRGAYLWGISCDSKATLLYAESDGKIVDVKLLPTPISIDDLYGSRRPMLAICSSVNTVSSSICYQCKLRFVSLQDGDLCLSYLFESKILSMNANTKFIVCAHVDAITVFSSVTLRECVTLTYVKPNLSSHLLKSLPFSLGDRWLAFPDLKPVCQHLSRCGDASTDESQPLTSTVLSMNRRLWDGISALATSVVGSTGSLIQTVPHSTVHNPDHLGSPHQSSSVNQLSYPLNDPKAIISPGYVTIVDLSTLISKYYLSFLKTESANVDISELPSTHSKFLPNLPFDSPQKCISPEELVGGRNCLNVHQLGRSGAIVAHFMAHRWANVALLKFDPSGSLLFTACQRGHSFNLFRIANHPFDQRQTAVHHLYILERGNMPCEIVDATFSHDSRWITVSSNHGTAHVFPISPYGGMITVRTHTRPYVVNRTSRYHRSCGLEEFHLTRPQLDRNASNDRSSLTTNTLSNKNLIYQPFSNLEYQNCQLTNQTANIAPDYAPPLPVNFCQTAPVAGLFPHCPHLSVSDVISYTSHSETSFVSTCCGTRSFAYDVTSTSLCNADNVCACPLNAHYNITNSRLPPYPQPCRIKAEARLKPTHHVTNTNSTATALHKITPLSNQKRYFAKPDNCGHQFVNSALSRHSHSSTKHLNKRDWDSMQAVGSVSLTSCIPGSMQMAAYFGSPICFLPNQPRHNVLGNSDCRSDPYGSRSRAVDALFVLTNDLYLIEYDICVYPAETTEFGEKLYQESAIRVDCFAVGEWNLRTDAVYKPPFHKQHPLLQATVKLQALHQNANKSDSDYVTAPISTDENETHFMPTDNPSHTPEATVLSSLGTFNYSDQSRHKSQTKQESVPGDWSVKLRTSWKQEDMAVYWYSQVEVTTHLGPLRRIWMGPQFTFRTYSKRREWSGPGLILPYTQPSDFASTTARTVAFHPALVEALTSTNVTSPNFAEVNMCVLPSVILTDSSKQTDLVDLIERSPIVNQSTNLTVVGTDIFTGTSTNRHSPISKSIVLARHLPGPLHDPINNLRTELRWRNRSGEATRPLSIAGGINHCNTDHVDMTVVIEGGSYQNSSLGSSLSSLVGRSVDDVAQSIAEAIQDEEIHWTLDELTHSHDNQAITCSTNNSHLSTNRGVSQFNVKSSTIVASTNSVTGGAHATAIRPNYIHVESMLSEADFPSQDASPVSVENKFPSIISVENKLINLELKDESISNDGNEAEQTQQLHLTGDKSQTKVVDVTINLKNAPKNCRKNTKSKRSTKSICAPDANSDTDLWSISCQSDYDSLGTSPATTFSDMVASPYIITNYTSCQSVPGEVDSYALTDNSDPTITRNDIHHQWSDSDHNYVVTNGAKTKKQIKKHQQQHKSHSLSSSSQTEQNDLDSVTDAEEPLSGSQTDNIPENLNL